MIASAIYLFAILAIVSYLTSTPISRGYLLLACPRAPRSLLTRALWRRRLLTARRSGRRMSRVLVLGDDEESARIIAELERKPEAGYQVVAVSGPGKRRTSTPRSGRSLPRTGAVMSTECSAMPGADTVIVASDAALSVQKVREISWQLEAGRQHLIMAPSLTDIGGPRIHTRPVAGSSPHPRRDPAVLGAAALLKRSFDLVGSGAAPALLAPLFAVLALSSG